MLQSCKRIMERYQKSIHVAEFTMSTMAFQVPKYSAEKKSRVRAENFDQGRVRAKKWVVRVSAKKRWREVRTRAQNIVWVEARGLARTTLGERPGRRSCLSGHRALIAPARPPGVTAVLFLFRQAERLLRCGTHIVRVIHYPNTRD